MQNVNVAVITGNLTRDPKLRTTEGGTKVCNLRVLGQLAALMRPTLSTNPAA